jgi:hypothetical protein
MMGKLSGDYLEGNRQRRIFVIFSRGKPTTARL